MVNIVGFEDNVEVIHIGDLHKSVRAKDWKIYIWFEPLQNVKSTKFTNLPLLSRRKILNSTQTDEREVERVIEIKYDYRISNALMSDFGRLSRAESVNNKDGEQYAFKIQQTGEPTLYLPQLELARSIFLVNSYMCRACLRKIALGFDFQVSKNDETDDVEIRISFEDVFPLKAFDDSATMTVLAWILTNKDALNSYASISSKFNKERETHRTHLTWRFNFDPPSLLNWRFHVRGSYSEDKKSYLINEIVGIDIDSDMPASVVFIHPQFIRKEGGNRVIAGSTNPSWAQTGTNVQLDDSESASDSSDPEFIAPDAAWVRFTRGCRVKKMMRIEEATSIVPGGSDESDTRTRRFSTSEPNFRGTLPSAEFGGGREDTTDYEHEYASRFACFTEMLEILSEDYECVIVESTTIRLPSTGRSRVHLMSDGNHRAVKAVKIRRSDQVCVLIEVDTSDTSSLLSTKLILSPDFRKWDSHFSSLRRNLVINSLAWPAELLDNLFGQRGHLSIPHPKHDGSLPGFIPLQAMDSWASRIFRKLP